MNILTVLSHKMSNGCMLNDESVARAMLAIQIFEQGGYELLVTTGWAYRTDCTTPISDVFKDFLRSNSDIDVNRIISDVNSRDTVGDAYFLHRRLINRDCSDITVVTSDYHVERTKIIYEKFFEHVSNISVIGVQTDNKNNPDVMRHEMQSIRDFDKTFYGIDFSDLYSVYQTLTTRHPFYNGDVYEKFDCCG